MSYLYDLLSGDFQKNWKAPGKEIKVRSHRVMQEVNRPVKSKGYPVQARTKIIAVLDDFNWKSIDQIAKETCLGSGTVAITTDRMYGAGKIERSKRNTPNGKVNVFRKK